MLTLTLAIACLILILGPLAAVYHDRISADDEDVENADADADTEPAPADVANIDGNADRKGKGKLKVGGGEEVKQRKPWDPPFPNSERRITMTERPSMYRALPPLGLEDMPSSSRRTSVVVEHADVRASSPTSTTPSDTTPSPGTPETPPAHAPPILQDLTSHSHTSHSRSPSPLVLPLPPPPPPAVGTHSHHPRRPPPPPLPIPPPSSSPPRTSIKSKILSTVKTIVYILAIILFIFSFAVLIAHCLAWFIVYKTEARLGEVRSGLLRGGEMRMCLCAH